MLETRPLDIAEYLQSEQMIASYLEAVIQDGDEAEIREALTYVARAKEMNGTDDQPVTAPENHQHPSPRA